MLKSMKFAFVLLFFIFLINFISADVTLEKSRINLNEPLSITIDLNSYSSFVYFYSEAGSLIFIANFGCPESSCSGRQTFLVPLSSDKFPAGTYSFLIYSFDNNQQHSTKFAVGTATAATETPQQSSTSCYDGTPVGECSSSRGKPYYCSDVSGSSELITNCYGTDLIAGTSDDCGCPTIYPYCQADGSCSGSAPAPAATCYDGIQNQDEIGVDCGGVCTACSLGTCFDGTAQDTCSTTKPNYCDNGILKENYCYGKDLIIGTADDCGCPSGQICQSDGSCVIPTTVSPSRSVSSSSSTTSTTVSLCSQTDTNCGIGLCFDCTQATENFCDGDKIYQRHKVCTNNQCLWPGELPGTASTGPEGELTLPNLQIETKPSSDSAVSVNIRGTSLIFLWESLNSKIQLTSEQKIRVEQLIIQAATEYQTTKYVDSPIDFTKMQDRKIYIGFSGMGGTGIISETLGMYVPLPGNPGSGLISLSDDLFTSDGKLLIVSFHEFSHYYDDIQGLTPTYRLYMDEIDQFYHDYPDLSQRKIKLGEYYNSEGYKSTQLILDSEIKKTEISSNTREYNYLREDVSDLKYWGNLEQFNMAKASIDNYIKNFLDLTQLWTACTDVSNHVQSCSSGAGCSGNAFITADFGFFDRCIGYISLYEWTKLQINLGVTDRTKYKVEYYQEENAWKVRLVPLVPSVGTTGGSPEPTQGGVLPTVPSVGTTGGSPEPTQGGILSEGIPEESYYPGSENYYPGSPAGVTGSVISGMAIFNTSGSVFIADCSIRAFANTCNFFGNAVEGKAYTCSRGDCVQNTFAKEIENCPKVCRDGACTCAANGQWLPLQADKCCSGKTDIWGTCKDCFLQGTRINFPDSDINCCSNSGTWITKTVDNFCCWANSWTDFGCWWNAANCGTHQDNDYKVCT